MVVPETLRLSPDEVGEINATFGTWADPLHTFYKNLLESGLPGGLAENLTLETWRCILESRFASG